MMDKRFDVKKWSCSDAIIQHRIFKERIDELENLYLRDRCEFILSLPIPMTYEVWSRLHIYLGGFE